jgi:hypothetical protein
MEQETVQTETEEMEREEILQADTQGNDMKKTEEREADKQGRMREKKRVSRKTKVSP